MKYTIIVDDKSKAGSILVELAKIFSKLYKSISILSDNELSGTSSKAKRKVELLDDFKQSVKEVKGHTQGKVKLKSARELLDEL